MTTPFHRQELGAAAVLPVEEAVAWLPMDASDAEAWLREAGVVRKIGRRHAEVVVWGDVLDAIKTGAKVQMPLTTWRAVAAACGVNEDTLAKRRAAAGDTREPYFDGHDAARSWYATLLTPRKSGPKSRRGRAKALATAEGAVDWGAIGRGR